MDARPHPVAGRNGNRIPAPTGRRVQRPRLVRRIEQSECRLMLLVAPSGFGKTSLLTQWAATTPADVAWVSCREADQDPTRFWPHLVGVCTDRWPTIGTDAALILRRPSWEDEVLVDTLCRDLADVHAKAAIVLDDSQFLEPFHRLLVSLARQLPDGVRLVMASAPSVSRV